MHPHRVHREAIMLLNPMETTMSKATLLRHIANLTAAIAVETNPTRVRYLAEDRRAALVLAAN